MNFYNINDPSEKASLRQAVLNTALNIPGLYMPENIPVLPVAFFNDLKGMSLPEIGLEASKAMLGRDIPESALKHIVKEALTFEIPLKQIDKDVYVLELFHGPTLAFKDVGARYMAALFEYFLQNENHDITLLVATSGDTGSAVANAFYNKKGIHVVILYPSGKVSAIQEIQMTTIGGNITALEVNGDFDDCQRLVKLAFADTELNSRLTLTSANSINFARLFPQSIYYFYATAQLTQRDNPLVFSVPSGNFGNLTAGLIAKRMGLDVSHFIASTNSNHAVVDYLENGKFEPHQTVPTITNAMDVGNPSNFPRILELYKSRHHEIKSTINGYWFTDEQTVKAMNELQKLYSYQADPHGAVGYLGLKKFQERNNCMGVFLETAHPAKFPDEVEKATNIKVKIPERLKDKLDLKKRSVKMPNNFESFRSYLKQLL